MVAEDELQTLFSANSCVCYDCTALVQMIFHLRDELKKTEERFTVVACAQPHVAVALPTALLSAESPTPFSALEASGTVKTFKSLKCDVQKQICGVGIYHDGGQVIDSAARCEICI